MRTNWVEKLKNQLSRKCHEVCEVRGTGVNISLIEENI